MTLRYLQHINFISTNTQLYTAFQIHNDLIRILCQIGNYICIAVIMLIFQGSFRQYIVTFAQESCDESAINNRRIFKPRRALMTDSSQLD